MITFSKSMFPYSMLPTFPTFSTLIKEVVVDEKDEKDKLSRIDDVTYYATNVTSLQIY
jgi:hypothetical protein